MPINTKKPAMKQTVGAQYMCFADATEGKEYDGTYEADVEKTEVVKSVKVTENSETRSQSPRHRQDLQKRSSSQNRF